MKRLFAAFTALALIGTAASAAPPQLKGQYAFTGAAHCVSSRAGFTPSPGSPGLPAYQAICSDTHQPIGVQPYPASPRNTCPGVSSFSFSVQGVRTFNGDGTGSVVGRSVSLDIPPNTGSIGASASYFTSSFTYTIDNAGVLTLLITPGTFQSTVVSGPREGQTFTINQFPLDGFISNDKKQITLSTSDPFVETQQFANGDVSYRICNRSRVLIWMGN